MRAAQMCRAWHQLWRCRLRLGATPASDQSQLWLMCIAESLMFKIPATNSCLFVDTELFKSGQRSEVLLHMRVPLSSEVPLSRML